jgi:hypothetical protein
MVMIILKPWLRTCLLSGVLAWPALISAADNDADVATRLQECVKTLAADEFEGRGVGTKGLEKAAEYVRNAFADAGLEMTSAGGDPFQEFEVTTGAKLTGPNSLSLFGPDGQPVELGYDADFRTCSFGQAGEFEAGIVFCGYGIESDEPAYNDFEGLDVTGKVVIIMRRNPQQADENGMFAVAHGNSRHASLSVKVSNAFQHGAAGVLIVNDPYSGRNQHEQLQSQLGEAERAVISTSEGLVGAADDAARTKANEDLAAAVRHLQEVRKQLSEHSADPLMAFGYGGTRSGRSLPIMQITQGVCDRMLQAALNKSLSDIEAEIDATGQPASAELQGWTARGVAGLETVRVPVSNVVGILEGEGPHADETVVVGAHYDHVGMGGEGSLAPGSNEVHNGADDNASGTAVLIELARRLSGRSEKPARRIVFLAFTGEERGLLGSAEYVKEPIFPLESTVAMINMDMVGRLEDDRLTVFGTGTSPVWNDWLDQFAAAEQLELAKKPEGFGPSDHASFYPHKIPVLHLFTGTHSDYHRPGDDWDKLNYDGMVRIADLVEDVVDAVASAPERPAYVEVQGRASIDRDGARPYFGSIPDFGSDAPGYAIQGVSPGSPADMGGLQSGDVIIKLGGNQIGGLDDFDLALRKYTAGQEVEVVVLRGSDEVTLKVTLALPRS